MSALLQLPVDFVPPPSTGVLPPRPHFRLHLPELQPTPQIYIPGVASVALNNNRWDTQGHYSFGRWRHEKTYQISWFGKKTLNMTSHFAYYTNCRLVLDFLSIHVFQYSLFVSSADFYPNVTIYATFGSLLSQIRLSSVTFVRPTQGSKHSAIFFAILYLSHPLTFVQNFTEIIPGEPLRRGEGVKRKRGSKIERRHVRVYHISWWVCCYKKLTRRWDTRMWHR